MEFSDYYCTTAKSDRQRLRVLAGWTRSNVSHSGQLLNRRRRQKFPPSPPMSLSNPICPKRNQHFREGTSLQVILFKLARTTYQALLFHNIFSYFNMDFSSVGEYTTDSFLVHIVEKF